MGIEEKMYTYKAFVVSVYDGDTIRVDWDLGAGIMLQNEPLRLSGIDTPEVRGKERPEGLISKDFVVSMILKRDIIIQTEKDTKGSFGRYLATIWYQKRGEENYTNLNKELLELGLAEPYSK